MFKARMKKALIAATFLGFICILGFIAREGYRNNGYYILALWYNRLLMGIFIGLLAGRKSHLVLIRGAIAGFLISLAFFLSTGLADPVSFFAGIIYGIIIDAYASNYTNAIIRMTRNLFNKI